MRVRNATNKTIEIRAGNKRDVEPTLVFKIKNNRCKDAPIEHFDFIDIV